MRDVLIHQGRKAVACQTGRITVSSGLWRSRRNEFFTEHHTFTNRLSTSRKISKLHFDWSDMTHTEMVLKEIRFVCVGRAPTPVRTLHLSSPELVTRWPFNTCLSLISNKTLTRPEQHVTMAVYPGKKRTTCGALKIQSLS